MEGSRPFQTNVVDLLHESGFDSRLVAKEFIKLYEKAINVKVIRVVAKVKLGKMIYKKLKELWSVVDFGVKEKIEDYLQVEHLSGVDGSFKESVQGDGSLLEQLVGLFKEGLELRRYIWPILI